MEGEAAEGGILKWRMEYEGLGVGGIASHSIPPSYIIAFLAFTYVLALGLLYSGLKHCCTPGRHVTCRSSTSLTS